LVQFEAAYGIDADNTAAHLGYAAALYGSGEYAKAAELYELYVAKYPDAEQSVEHLAYMYERQLQNPEKACHWYGKLTEFRTTDKELAVMRDFICKSVAK